MAHDYQNYQTFLGREDLDGAYNDGARPPPLGLGRSVILYGGLASMLLSFLVGSIYLLEDMWQWL